MIQEVNTSPQEVPKYDSHNRPVVDENGNVVTELGPHPYFNNLDKSKWPGEGQSLELISTEIFQSINPFFIILFTPLIIGLID